MIVVGPGTKGVTTPVNAPIVAFEGELLVQLPPDTISVNVIGIPTHRVAGPMIGPGEGLTVTMVAVWQPVAVNV